MSGSRNPLKKSYPKHEIYATLQMKLTACLAVIFRGLLLPGRMGETCLRMSASTSGGDTLPRKNCLQTCTATAKFALQAYLQSAFWMITGEVTNSVKLYMMSLANTSWYMCSTFFAWKWSRPTVYFSSRKEVSILSYKTTARIYTEFYNLPQIHKRSKYLRTHF